MLLILMESPLQVGFYGDDFVIFRHKVKNEIFNFE
jgi:hypothetical protein